MTESRKLAAILAADVVGFSRLTGADEDRTLARLRGLRSDLIDPWDTTPGIARYVDAQLPLKTGSFCTTLTATRS
jgi:hypothetical protein